MIFDYPFKRDYTDIFESNLDEMVPFEKIREAEMVYYKAIRECKRTHELNYEYSKYLIKSYDKADVDKGILILEYLCVANPDGVVNYFYILSMAHARLKEYPLAFSYLSKYDLKSPKLDFIVEWKKYLEARMKREARKKYALIAGTGMVCAGIGASIGMMLQM